MDHVNLHPIVDKKRVLQPFYYLMESGGKRFRVKLGAALNVYLNIPNAKLATIHELVELSHNSSLVMDDIQDYSIIRRGKPAVHCVFGIADSMNSMAYVTFAMVHKTLSLQHPKALPVFVHSVSECLRGQVMDIHWRDNCICPTEEEYMDMVGAKTGSLFKQIFQLMQLFSKNNRKEHTRLVEILGYIFQIRNDYINLCSENYMGLKSFCEDITEGKFGFPVVHAINSHPEDCELINILRQRPKDIEIKKRFVAIVEKYGSFEYTRKVLNDLRDEAEEIISKLDENPLMKQIVDLWCTMED